MRYLPIEQIEDDQILAMPVYDNMGNTLLGANMVLKRKYLDRLHRLGYVGLYIYDEISENISVQDLLSEETRNAALKALKTLNLDECRLVAHSMVEELINQPYISVDMVNLSSFDNYTYVHCINVAVLSITIGIGCGLTNRQLVNLSQAALLHDIGKTKIDLKILNKIEPLNEEEMDMIKEHPLEGYNMLKDNFDIPAVVKNAILSHHENEDGSGYPRKLKSKNIHQFAKIIRICDVYDALVSKRIYKEEINPAEAFEYLMSNCGTLFDIKYVKKLMEYVSPYPTGITVELSNGEKAIIASQNLIYKTRPTVILLDTKEKINLMEVLNLTIVKILT